MQKGFTLIELLVVIAIIAILSGVIFTVINPAYQQRRASEAVMRTNTDQLCHSLAICSISRTEPLVNCFTAPGTHDTPSFADTLRNLGSMDPTNKPLYSTYDFANNGGSISVTSEVTVGGHTCQYSCAYNLSDGTYVPIHPVATSDCLPE
jgi:prepilin-type N-terminal cleavage/methylation domain-containing protein